MYNYNFNSMSTMVRISINQELFANDLMPVYKRFTSVEETCSRFKVNSELSLLNQHVGKEKKVSDEFFSILKDALAFYKETNGIFNPGILAAIHHSGYTKSIEYIRGKELTNTAKPTPVQTLTPPYEINEEQKTVLLHTGIDLGGMAKGWAIDRGAELLAAYGSGFINVGGDIRLFGSLPQPLNIGIEDPFDPDKLITGIQISSGALATSTSMKRRWQVNGNNMHHLIDPETGVPSQSTIVSATVTAPTALEADVWAKVTLLLGETNGKKWISDKKEKAVLINKKREIWRGGE